MHEFWAHSPNPEESIPAHPLRSHLRDVSCLAMQYGQDFTMPSIQDILRVAGLLHDLGKYKLEFQRERLSYDPQTGELAAGTGRRVDHSSLGAVVAYPPPGLPIGTRNASLTISRIIAAHHAGLTDTHAFEDRIRTQQYDPSRQDAMASARAELPELQEVNALLARASLDLDAKSQELLTRMLLSCLVDADQTDTEAHCSPRKSAVRRRRAASLSQLLTRVEHSQAQFTASSDLNQLRRQMYEEALDSAALRPGFFRLTMPTGAGKTRTSLAFALRHALNHELRRVIYAIPYTNIIDQTAQVFRAILDTDDEENVLEHHSALDPSNTYKDETRLWAKLLTETWNAPLIVTTTVQLFESLFANRTSQVRKLHNVAGSVIVLDEVQSLPTHLLRPILDVLDELVTRYRVSVVLCTATQPALSRDSGFDFAELNDVRDIVADPQPYFRKLVRVTYHVDISKPTSWETVAAKMMDADQVLSIVNLRRHARALYQQLCACDPHALHLSTHMFPAHRKRHLRLIRGRLAREQSCRVVSTQLIECGVDVDFPKVFRALGPLDSIVQAAGRCNREGKLKDEHGKNTKGEVWVFKPEDAVTPKGDYFVKVQKAETVLRDTPDLDSPEAFKEYFQDVYLRSATDARGIQRMREDLEFGLVAQAFKMIDADTVPVVITSIKAGDHRVRLRSPTELLEQLETNQDRAGRELWRELQMYSVNIFRTDLPKLSRYLRQVRYASGQELDLYEWTGVYDYRMGIQFEDDPERFFS